MGAESTSAVTEQYWWKSETGVGITSWRGKLRTGLFETGQTALWQEPLFTCPTEDLDSEGSLAACPKACKARQNTGDLRESALEV